MGLGFGGTGEFDWRADGERRRTTEGPRRGWGNGSKAPAELSLLLARGHQGVSRDSKTKRNQRAASLPAFTVMAFFATMQMATGKDLPRADRHLPQ